MSGSFFRINFMKKKKKKVMYTIVYSFIILVIIANKPKPKSDVPVVNFRGLSSNFNGPLQIDQFRSGFSEKLKTEELGLFDPPNFGRSSFDSRIRDFFKRNHCKHQIFMTWISAVDSFGYREFIGLETLFQTNPTACLIILSKSMDSIQGHDILNPLIIRGFRVKAISPDLRDLLKDTPAECWLNEIRAGIRDPGEIPLAQNLSNLLRLAALYKYGGIYLDTDFIIVQDILGLRNSIGAQSADTKGHWTRLNNAVLIFDKKHPLIHEFISEFAVTFDGNIWGNNGPYLVSRVVNRTLQSTGQSLNFTILPPAAFYPVNWKRIAGYFKSPKDRAGKKWAVAKVMQLRRMSYGVHLWNRQSRRLKIEEESIVGRLMSDLCVICSRLEDIR